MDVQETTKGVQDELETIESGAAVEGIDFGADRVPDADRVIDTKNPKNRCNRIFGRVIVKPVETVAKTFEQERTGTKSKKLALVQVEIGNTGIFLKGTLYARKYRNAKKTVIETAWFGANQQVAVTGNTPEAKADLQSWGVALATNYAKWLKDHPSAAAAVAQRDDAPEVEGVSLD